MQKTTVYFDEKFIQNMDSYVKELGLKSRNELIEKSINFYMDYKHNEKPGTFLSKEIQAIISGTTELTEKRLGNRFAKLFSDMAIQVGILEQIMQDASNFNESEILNMRKKAVDAIKNTQSVLKYNELAK